MTGVIYNRSHLFYPMINDEDLAKFGVMHTTVLTLKIFLMDTFHSYYFIFINIYIYIYFSYFYEIRVININLKYRTNKLHYIFINIEK